VIRRATERDVAALAGIQLRSALDAYAHIFPADAPPPMIEDIVASWSDEVAAPTSAVFAAEADGRIVGGVVASTDDSARGYAHLRKLYVDPPAWRKGVGRLLHDEAVAWLRAAGLDSPSLWVLERNDRARTMYERWGWELVPDDGFTHDGIDVTEVRYTLTSLAAR
jgi:GNAT superfamily N-acetyltransferase